MLHGLTLQCHGRVRYIFRSAMVGQRRCMTNFLLRKGREKMQLLPLNRLLVVKRKHSCVLTVCSALRKDRTSSLQINEATGVDDESLPMMATSCLPIYNPADSESAESFIKLPLKCRGCGAFMQTQDPTVKGYILPKKLPSLVRRDSMEDLVCSNCFSLRYANRALTLGIDKGNVLWQLQPLKNSRALILYVVDIMDINGSLMPEIMPLIGENKAILIVGNKLDMLALDDTDKPRRQENHVAGVLRKCCVDEGLDETLIKDVCLVSGVSGYGFEKLIVLINKYRDIDMNLYIMGSTNVGKSTVFNMLQNLTAISKDADIPTQAIVHRIPGSTNGLVRYPLAYWRMKKVRKMLLQKPIEDEQEQTFEFVEDIIKDIKPSRLQNRGDDSEVSSDETALDRLLDHDLSEDVDLHSLEKQRRWMYDTPSLLNTQQRFFPFDASGGNNGTWEHSSQKFFAEQYLQKILQENLEPLRQITQFLTPSELKFIQQQLWVVPKTFLMRPGRSLLLGGLARIDYSEITRKSLGNPSQYEEVPKGVQSVFFTVFCSHNIPIHPTETEKASEVYDRNFGNHLLKIPFGDENRRGQFPELIPKEYKLIGVGWEESCADLAIAGIGWIAVTAGKGSIITLNLHTPNGIGQTQRDHCLMPHSVRKRGKRGVRYHGLHNKYIYQCTRKKYPQLVGSFEKQNEIMKAWLKKINEKQKYQRFEMKQERRRLLLEQGVKGRIRQYEEKLELIEQAAANIRALESGKNDDAMINRSE